MVDLCVCFVEVGVSLRFKGDLVPQLLRLIEKDLRDLVGGNQFYIIILNLRLFDN